MPTYNFKCASCGEIELVLKMSEIPLKKCPKCESEKIERDFKPIPIIWNCQGSFGKSTDKR